MIEHASSLSPRSDREPRLLVAVLIYHVDYTNEPFYEVAMTPVDVQVILGSYLDRC